MKVITLAKTKELLGITDSISDSKISAKIPYIDSKVKQISKNRYNLMILGDTTEDSPYVSVRSVYTSNGRRCDYYYCNGQYGYRGDGINNDYTYDSIEEFLETGQLISGSGIPDEAYIDEVYYNGDVYDDTSVEYAVPVVKLSANATADASSVRIYLGINIAYQDVIAKGIQYLIVGTNQCLPGGRVVSSGSVSYSDADSAIDERYGMPSWFIKAFPKYQSGH